MSVPESGQSSGVDPKIIAAALPRDHFKNSQVDAGDYLLVEDRWLRVFKITRGKLHRTIWADPATTGHGAPVRVRWAQIRSIAHASRIESQASRGATPVELDARRIVRTRLKPADVAIGSFLRCDGRWHRVVAMGKSAYGSRWRVADVASPDAPEQEMAWSDVQFVADVTASS